MLQEPIIMTFVVIVNLIAIIMTYLTFKKPGYGRFLFGGMFLLAGIFNLYYAFFNPDEFIYYTEFAVFDLYKEFFIGIYSDNSKLILMSIAGAQLVTGFGFWSKGAFVKYASIAGIIFLIGILPMGLGAAFPSTLIMAAGIYKTYTRSFNKNLWDKFKFV